MNKYIIFLRAVNVSGKNLIKMSELKDKLSNSGFLNVKTYIQSGNIIVNTAENRESVISTIKTILTNYFELDIDVFVLTKNELQTFLDHNPFSIDLPKNKVYFTFLNKTPAQEEIDNFHNIDLAPEEFKIVNNILYFYLPEGMANSKLNNNFIEKKLKVRGTGRNVNTINKMLSLIED